MTEEFFPFFSLNNVPIVFPCSDFFVPYLGVAIESLLEFSSIDNNYDLIILEKEIEDFNKEKLKSIVLENKNFSLRFLNVKELVHDTIFYLPNNNPELYEESYYTMLIPWVLKNYQKVIVLDCDIIINKDVAELYKFDLKENYLGAAKEYLFQGFLNNPKINKDFSLSKYCKNTLKMNDEYEYYQAGVLLMNLPIFREKFELNDLLEQISKNAFTFLEQDLLNKICNGHILEIGYEWNYMACRSKSVKFDIGFVSDYEKKKYEKAKNNIGIYHFITIDKPWKKPELEYADIWWKYARMSNFYEICLFRMATDVSKQETKRLEPAICDFMVEANLLPDTRTRSKKIIDAIMPKRSLRRKIAKKIYRIFKRH